MSGEELINAVRQSVGDAHMDVPAEQVVSRSHAIRTRRIISAATGALALAAGLAMAVTALVPASPQTTARLSA